MITRAVKNFEYNQVLHAPPPNGLEKFGTPKLSNRRCLWARNLLIC